MQTEILLLITVIQAFLHYTERRHLYSRICGDPPKREVKSIPHAAVSAHRKIMQRWKQRREE